jgi:hypothetical protein
VNFACLRHDRRKEIVSAERELPPTGTPYNKLSESLNSDGWNLFFLKPSLAAKQIY